MKIEKNKGKYYNGVNWFYHYYLDSQTNRKIDHGLLNSYYDFGYSYHGEYKGFCLRYKNRL